VYVTRLDAARISRADLPTLTFGDSVTVGQTPTDVAFDPMGATAYVANQFGNSVGVVDVATNRQIRTIAVNGNPFRVLVSPDGRRLYVTTNAANLLVIDRTSGSTVLEYSLPSPSNGLAFHPNGVLLYGTTLDGLVYEIDTATDSARALTTTGMLQDIAVTRDGGQLIIARQDGPLEVRDTDTGVLLQTVGAASGVLGLRLSPDGTRLYAGLLSGDVRVLDPRTWTVVQTVSVSSPRRIAFDRLGAVAAIADESGAVVFVQ
jgi:YVTN family beta-propeller protein